MKSRVIIASRRMIFGFVALASFGALAALAAAESLGEFKAKWLASYEPRLSSGVIEPLPPRIRDPLLDSAEEQSARPVRYSGAYYRIPFPGGDVPAGVGACTDIVVRAYRKSGIDLQAEVHADMKSAFGEYPRLWAERSPNPNIDHRRVANLLVFFGRRANVLPLSKRGLDWSPGDLVVWELSSGSLHIGIVGRRTSADGERPLVIHNLSGTAEEDVLFSWRLLGRFRFDGRRR